MIQCVRHFAFLRLEVGEKAVTRRKETLAACLFAFCLLLGLPTQGFAENCRPLYQDTMIGFVNDFRGTAARVTRNQTVSNNAQINSQAIIANNTGANYYQYPGYTQLYSYGYNSNTEVYLNGQWVIANSGGNWGNVNPGGVFNKLKISQPTLLRTPNVSQIGIGCEQIDYKSASWTYAGFLYRTHTIQRAWTIAFAR